VRNDKWLKKVFTSYNELYYNGSLPSNIKVRFGKPSKNHDAHWDPINREIVINEDLRDHDKVTLICLHHEMAHVKLDTDRYVGGATVEDPHHGMRFQAEINRLYRMGAYDGLL